jgi:phosphate-selective porin OprO/OprP
MQDNLTLGLNWYVSPNIRFMLNYVNVLDLDRPGAPEDGDSPDIIQLRAQFNY